MQNRADQNKKHKRVTFKLIKLYLKPQKQCINSLEKKGNFQKLIFHRYLTYKNVRSIR
jgi:hypothetical protein